MIYNITFCDLPNDIIQIIIGYLQSINRVKIKMTCKLMYNLVEDFPFDIAKQMLFKKFGIFNCQKYCANNYCCEETEDIFYRYYCYNILYWQHTKQEPLGKTKMIINNKIYKVVSPYCCECFKKYVLVRERENITHNYRWSFEPNISFN